MTAHSIPDWQDMPDRRDSIMKHVGMVGGPVCSTIACFPIGSWFVSGRFLWQVSLGGLVGFLLCWAVLSWRCTDGALFASHCRKVREAWRRCECGCRGERP